tara:strand:- start:426 stop:776 length:351 start_codon:yes stop_codon:yes gene_type:complete
MRGIKLHFTDKKYLDGLYQDSDFMADIKYLNAYKSTQVDLILFDPITNHNHLDTEIVVLSKVSRAIKRIFFPDSRHNIKLLNSVLNEQKGGLTHDKDVIINSTDIQITNFEIRVSR